MRYKKLGRKHANLFLILALCLVIPESLYAFKAGAHAVMSNETAYALPPQSVIRGALLQYPEIAAWGSTGPDLPANSQGILIDDAPWFEAYHYEKVGTFTAELLRLALRSNDPKNIAWAAGWVTHVVGDLYCHGVFVNPDPEVDGVYLANPDTKEMHGLLEAWADKLLFSDKSNPKRSYTAQNMQATFRSFESLDVRNLMANATQNVYGKSPSPDEYKEWMDFFKNVYIDTGVAGGTNWVYDNTYGEVTEQLREGVLRYGPFAGMTRAERLDLAYQQAKQLCVTLLSDAERNVFQGFSDAWNLDAYHLDHRSIGTLTVSIRTADVFQAGTDDDVFFGLIRDDGEEWKSPVLDKGSGLLGLGSAICNDFERGSNETYYLFVDRGDFPPSRISQVFLEKSDDFLGGGWKIGSLTVTINGIPYFDGTVNTWLQDDHLKWTGAVQSVPPQHIPVNLRVNADAVQDRVEIQAVNLSAKTPYTGPATIHLQHSDGQVENYPITIGINGTYSRSLTLRPDDLIQVNVYQPLDNNPQIIYRGNTSLKNPSVSYEAIDFNADVFNDLVSGTIGGDYSGPVRITVTDDEGAMDDREFSITATRGYFSQMIPLIGTNRVSVKVQFEGVALPRGGLFKIPNLDALELECETTGPSALKGTVSNRAKGATIPYTGDVMLEPLHGNNLAALTQAVAYSNRSQLPKKSKREVGNDTNIGRFEFSNISLVLSLGYKIGIEHDGVVKYLCFDPLEEMTETAQRPVQSDFVSAVNSKIDKVVNPVQGAVLTQANSMNTSMGEASTANVAFIQMLPATTQVDTVWNGVWETNLGSMILSQSNNRVTGFFGDEEYQLNGQVSADSLEGVFTLDGLLGEFKFTLYDGGCAFDGVSRFKGEDSWEQWNGRLVAPLDNDEIAPGENTLEGVWFSEYGAIVLDATDLGYTGVYGEGENTLEGIYSKGMFKGSLQEQGRSGDFQFTVSSDEKLFKGKFRYTGEEEWQTWDGWKKK
ncbi:hypothetical protein SpiGrapes_1315 [Sphaerochaeta pleomorpha str. Grapes]|uniref:PLAT domain-containing protein n=1 Tax=Sphaerochaeta pleomorpha (strain ATCC BAA-1885 / DSM 22778 / Grapes) TaxID=158190 RepID=G8QTV2_SPHPG|nr:zinc dependent phospholipase C family protein [Sphaerochaeta pleomorpha]AEV29128.1 hypothetical protein SpiGrapes_1315 [Sphaerochaeta pleomorpha str. Grapes]